MSSPRMAKRTATTKATSHTTQCFAELLSRDPELSALRADYAQKPATKRRAAAEWVYDESISNSLFGAALARLQGERLPAAGWPPGFAALAIDPEYAPALLTVGCYEQDEAEKVFLALGGRLKHGAIKHDASSKSKTF